MSTPAQFDPRFMGELRAQQFAQLLAEHEQEIRRRERERIAEERALAERRIQALMPTQACTERADCRW